MTKEHILQEINRLALANGGKPPGKGNFYSKTGIKESDWYGKYWSKWSDALTEVGLIPNQLQAAYPEDFLIGKLIDLTRELGRFPVVGEIRIKAHNNSDFPSDTTFRLRLGPKSQRIAKVIKYCHERDGFEDVILMCQAVSLKTDLESDIEEVENIGFVYLMKSGRFYKIGKSNSIGRRQYELSIQLPEEAKTIHEIRTDDPIGIEAYWHKRFAKKRKGGEWFDLSASDIRAFKRWLRIA